MSTRYVDPDATPGGDGQSAGTVSGNTVINDGSGHRPYASLSIWEAALPSPLTEVETCICLSQTPLHTADATACIIDGTTTTAAFYIDIKTDAAARHAGKWDTAKYRMTITNGICIDNNEEFVRVTGLQFQVTKNGSANPSCGIRADQSFTGGGCTYDRCIAVGVVSGVNSGNAIGFYLNNNLDSVRNCLAYNFINAAETHYGFRHWPPAASAVTSYNNTAYNCNTGFRREDGTLTCTNCGAAACTTGFSGTITQNTCSSATPTFIDAAGGDFHLHSGDVVWNGLGTDLSGTFTLDIDGQLRSAPWDIGADDVPPPPPPVIYRCMAPTQRM